MSKNIFIEKESDSVYFVRLKKEYYSPDAVIMSANMFTDKCYVKIDELPDDYVGGLVQIEILREIIYKKAFLAVGGVEK